METRKKPDWGGGLKKLLLLAAAVISVLLVLRAEGINLFTRHMSGQEYTQYVRQRAEETIPYFDRRYFLTALSDRDLDVAVTVYQCAMNFRSSCRFDRPVGEEDLARILTALNMDCPELMQMDLGKASFYSYSALTRLVIQWEPVYTMQEGEYTGLRQACEEQIRRLLEETEGLDSLARERYIFETLAQRCLYSTEAPHCAQACGLLVDGSAKCDGISKGFKWVMEAAGERCLTVTADIPGQDVGHAWNILELDGAWYRVDLTQSVRNEKNGDIGFPGVICYAFNIADSIPKTEYVINEKLLQVAELPQCVSMDKSAYAGSGRLIRAGENPLRRLRQELDTLCRTGGGAMAVQFESNEDFASLDIRGLVKDVLNSQEHALSAQYIISEEYNLIAIVIRA